MFTDDELEALVLGLRLTAEHADLGLARAALDEVAKLRAVLPRELQRVVWPLALGFFERSRALVAGCESREDFRGFRVDRIAEFNVLAEKLPRSRMASLGEWREREGVGAQLTD